jgi:hypothetical protein
VRPRSELHPGQGGFQPTIASFTLRPVRYVDCGVRSIANAILSLISSIVGGILVLTGQYFTRRAEDRRLWLLRLHEAAADLATSYLQEAALVNDSRRSGHAKDEVATTTYVVDRQRALGRFRSLPWSSTFEPERLAMGAGIENLWHAWDESDEMFQRVYKDARSAVSIFMSSVGRHLSHPKLRVSKRAEWTP